MSSTAIPPDERAPSLMRDDDLFVPRLVGVLAAALVIFSSTSILLMRSNRGSAVGAGWSSILLTIGILGLLFHAAYDRDVQFRRVYMLFGYLAIGLGAFLCIIPYPIRVGDQFGPGYLCMSIGLLFLLCFLRHENDAYMRQVAFMVLLIAGAIMAAFGMLSGLIKPAYLLGNKQTIGLDVPLGLLSALLGLVYLVACINIRGLDDALSYRIAVIFGYAGLALFVLALGPSLLPLCPETWVGFRKFASGLFFYVKKPDDFFIPYGVTMEIVGLLYVCTAAFLCSDRPVVVLTRRELGSFFYSPIAHLVLFSFVMAHWIGYFFFTAQLLGSSRAAPEPIVAGFILQWSSIIWTIFGVPVLTMRLLAEEKRSGTLEQILTAPVSETPLVIGKFLAALVMFAIIWLPFGFLMVALRVEGGQPFDYRPLFGFGVGLFITGAAFVSVGLFLSSLTSNQIISAVLTFGFMLIMSLLFFIDRKLNSIDPEFQTSVWHRFLKHISYIDIWIDTMEGKIIPRFLLFPASLTVMCLFLSVKVLESRKWR